MTCLGPVVEFAPRFVPEHLLGELSMLWHLSRVPHQSNRYQRLLWASGEFHKLYPAVTPTAAYKDLETMLEFGGV